MKGVLTCAALVAAAMASTASGSSAARPATRFLVESVAFHKSPYVRLAVVDASGHLLRVLSANAGGAALSPDRRLVAYESVKGLVVEGIDGSDRHLVLPEHLRCGRHTVCESPTVAWSPDDKELLVGGLQIRNGQHRNWLSILSVASGRSHRIVGPRPGTNYYVLAWSGAANRIAYVADRGAQPSLVVAGPAGRSRRVLCSVTCGDPADDPTIGWSPDGASIAYSTLTGVAVYSLATRTTTVVPHTQPETPFWSPDSSEFAAEADGRVTFFSPTGSMLGTTSVKDAFLQGWNADGIYFVNNPDPDTLFVIPTGQTTSQKVFSLPRGQGILWAQPLQ